MRRGSDRTTENVAIGSLAEWATLQTAVIATLESGWELPGSQVPDDLLHLSPVSPSEVQRDLDHLAGVLTSRGVNVLRATNRLARLSGNRYAGANLAFARDLFIATAEGYVASRMASTVRAGEERCVVEALNAAGYNCVGSILSPGTLEGADCLFVSPDHAIVGVGERTNAVGAQQLEALLARAGVRVSTVRLPASAQHLLGCIQLVSPTVALVRRDLWPQGIEAALEVAEIVPLPFDLDSAEVASRTFNFTMLDPRTALLPAGQGHMKAALADLGINPVEVEIPALVDAGGGVGCAVGVVHRMTRQAAGPE